MSKLLTLIGAVIVAWAVGGSATEASAGYRHRGCCGPVAPSYVYKTKTVHKNVYRRHDVYRTRYVKRIHRIVHVTRIKPIVHVHKVTRVHTRLVGVVRPVHQHVTQYLPAKKIVTSKVVNLKPQCACSSRHHHHHY